MTGLDKILDQIAEQAQSVAVKIKENADFQVRSIEKDAQAEGEKRVLQIKEKTDAQCEDILARGKSAASLVKRRAVLQEKQQMIGAMLRNAKETLLTLPAEEYFNLVLKMAKKYALRQEGQIAFNAKDLARMSGTFIEELQKRCGTKLSLAKQPVQIDGGFVLIYGGIEENCSFEALFAGADEALQDEAHSLLFS